MGCLLFLFIIAAVPTLVMMKKLLLLVGIDFIACLSLRS